MSARADVLIVGGGPAGLAAAIEAATRGLEPVVIEPRRAPIDKACGEGLMPAARAALAALGVVVDGVPFAGIRYADAIDPEIEAIGTFPQGPGLGVRRTSLHAALHARALAIGVRFVARRAEGVRVDDQGVEGCGVRARWLIAADGLRSPVRDRLGLALPPRRAPRFGMRRHFAIAPWTDRVEVHWARGAEAYVTPVGPREVGVAMLYHPPARWDDLGARFPRLRERLEGAEVLGEARGAGPFERRVRARVRGRVLLVGDAAGYLDPLTGEGVALGIATARAAIACVAGDRPRAYERAYHRLTRAHFALTAALLDATRPRASHQPLIALLARTPWLFDRALGVLGGRAPEPAAASTRVAEPASRAPSRAGAVAARP